MAYVHIQKLLKQRRLTQKDMAAFMGIQDPVILTNLFKGRRDLKASEASAISKYLNIPVEKVLNPDYQERIPVIGKVSMDGAVEMLVDADVLRKNLHNLQLLKGVKFVPTPPSADFEDMFVVELDTEEGMLFYCAGVISDSFERYFDKRCFVITADGKPMVRHIRRGSSPALYDLVNDLHEVLRDQEIQWCARVRYTHYI